MKVKEFGKKIKNFAEDHKDAIVCGAIVVGGIIFYSSSFDYGYKCRVNFEKACDADTGSNIVEALKAYGK